MSRIVNLGVLVSGSGSNLQSIIDHIEKGTLPARIRIILGNNPGAFALERARRHGIPCAVIEHSGAGSREEYDRKLVDALQAHDVELVVLAGFMRVLSPLFLRAFPMRIMNIHPALLPSFPGTARRRPLTTASNSPAVPYTSPTKALIQGPSSSRPLSPSTTRIRRRPCPSAS
jgi:phosphoribosylglycinamide formyltransferase-1